MTGRFKIPKTRLQKSAFLSGNILDSVSDYINLKNHSADIKFKKLLCRVPTAPGLGVAEAIKEMNNAYNTLREVIKKDKTRQKIIQENVENLDSKKKELYEDIITIEKKCLKNLKHRESDKLETLSKIEGYIDSTELITKEKEKQDILIKIGLIIESVVEDLAPYEEILGRIALQENAFKSKADTLSIKKSILISQKENLNKKLSQELLQIEDLKKLLFETSFQLRENTHYKMNLINSLVGKDTKSMRAVLDLEYKLASLRRQAYQVRAENFRLSWFLDWVLFDVLGVEMLTGVTRSSSREEKTQCVIDSYKSMRIMLNQRDLDSEQSLDVFN